MARLDEVVEGAELVLHGVLALFAPIVAERRGIPWAPLFLSPISLWSAYDPPVLAPFPFLGRDLRFLGHNFHRPALRLLSQLSSDWVAPVRDIRKRFNLPDRGHPLLQGQFSPHLNLIMFSKCFAPAQRDWPAKSVQCGFPLTEITTLDDDLTAFLNAGAPPVVFALGSTSVHGASPPYRIFAEATARRGVRAVIVVGEEHLSDWREISGSDVRVVGHADYAALFPRADLVVHQGGIGTTAECMRAGRPMIVLPQCNDQFDNAEHASRLGVAEVLPFEKLTADRLIGRMDRIERFNCTRHQAAALGKLIAAENGLGVAVEAIESFVAKNPSR